MTLSEKTSSKSYSLLDPESLREDINNFPKIIHFLYALHVTHIQKIIFEKKWKKVDDFGKFRMFFFHVQALTSLLQNFKHYHQFSWFFCQIVWDTIAYLPYPASYMLREDIISHRSIAQKNASEVLMLISATWSNILNYFLITWQWEVVGLLAIHNKTTFWIAQLLKTKNNRWLNHPDQ